MITTTHSHKHWTDEGGHVSVIESWANRSLRVSGLRLSRNNGHQSALIAGLTAAVESCRVSAYVSSCSA